MSSEHFIEIEKWIRDSSNSLFRGYGHFVIWDSFERMIAMDIVGTQEATENVAIMNNLHHFFGLTIEAHKKMFIVELYKLFDTNDGAISLRRIIHSIRTHEEQLKKEPEYRGVNISLLNKCERRILAVGDIKKRLQDFRHEEVAHNPQIKTSEQPITVSEIEELFQMTSEVLNEISYNFNGHKYDNFHHKDISKHHTNLVVRYLSRFEPYRLKEIDDESKRTLEELERQMQPSF